MVIVGGYLFTDSAYMVRCREVSVTGCGYIVYRGGVCLSLSLFYMVCYHLAMR